MFKAKTRYRHKNYLFNGNYDIYTLTVGKPKKRFLKSGISAKVEMVIIEPKNNISLGYHYEPNFSLNAMNNYFEIKEGE